MSVTTFSSRKFSQEVSRAKKCANNGPVFITDRGTTTHVLMTYKEYRKRNGGEASIVELLAMPNDTPAFDFDPPRMGNIAREIDLG